MTRRALVTGITGQDGSYLAEQLIQKGYEVHGLIRRSSTFATERIEHLYLDAHLESAKLFLHYGDLADGNGLSRLVKEVDPHEVYNLGAQSHVAVSFQNPLYTADVVALGTLRMLEAIRMTNPDIRFYQASSSEMYGKVYETPQSETTPFHPRSPYAVGKVYSFWQAVNYREAYDMYACSGILFNHESPVRGETFVTRKITRGLARIHEGLDQCLYLGNLDALRDWGHARDYAHAQWLILQHDTPDDYVIATGEQHSVREFVELAAWHLGYTVEWRGQGADEEGVDRETGRVLVKIDPRYYRPAEVDTLVGDSTKARDTLGWQPRVSFEELVREMVESDLALARRDAHLDHHGFKVYRHHE